MPPTVSFVSLGCPKNLVDSEKMLGSLVEAGCTLVDAGSPADVTVVNTCGFLAASRDEAIDILRGLADQKRRGDLRRIVVAGCLVQRDGQRLVEEVPEIDALVGVHNRDDVLPAVLGRRATRGKSRRPGEPLVYLAEYHPLKHANWNDQARLRLTPRHYAYLRISEGCDQKCTFCTIPAIRGPMHCKPPAAILEEARELIADGASEILLIGQDTTSYGRDIGYAPGLAGLLRELDRLDGLRWLRLMYVYPTEMDDRLIAALAECEHVVRYVDMPLQHISDRVLKAMHRRVTRAQTEDLVDRLRAAMPGLALRTTFIAGFPGETEAEFEELRTYIREAEFDMVGVFPYSREPETPAGRMRGQIAPAVQQERVAALMREQQPIAFRKAAARKGQRFEVVIDGFGRDGVYPARHAGQAPEIDGVTYVSGGEHEPGDVVKVRGTGGRDYDVLAKPDTRSLAVLR